MNILSIGWLGGGPATAALMINGVVVAATSEERFTRVKNEDVYPLQAINAILDFADMSPAELDGVVFPGERFDINSLLTHKYSRFSTLDRLREQRAYWYPVLIEKKNVSFLDIFKDKLDVDQYPGSSFWTEVMAKIEGVDQPTVNIYLQDVRKKIVAKHLGIPADKISFIRHHRAHAYYAYYGSPMVKEKTLIFTGDAFGDYMNASISVANGSDIKMLGFSNEFIIGRLYRYMTLLLGLKPDEHEFKVMGLAAYCKPKYYKVPLSVFRNTMYVDGLGFAYREVPPDLYFHFRDKFEGYRFDSIAGAIQKYTEDILVEWANNALAHTGATRICFGGGVGMNIKAMMEIAKLPMVEDIFICPSPADDSLAIGAAYALMHDICMGNNINPTTVLSPLTDAYLGIPLTNNDIKTVLQNASIKGFQVKEKITADDIAHLIASGKIIGRCAGRGEFGARALGNRSIIADPRNTDVIPRINEMIKSRDFWMPFAPSILEVRSNDYLENPKNLKSPFMTLAFDSTLQGRKDLKAALHQADLTVRPQIVDKECNRNYHEIITAFDQRTGIGGVLNTSFNIHGEPIVQTAMDAFDVFERTDLDVLLLEDSLIEDIENRRK